MDQLHASGWWKATNAAVRAQVDEWITEYAPRYLTHTEAGRHRSALTLHDGYGVIHPRGDDGQAECAIQYRLDGPPLLSSRAVRLSSLPIPRRNGDLSHVTYGEFEDHHHIAGHLPSGVQGPAGLLDNEQARVYRHAIGGLRQFVATLDDRPVVMTLDWNLHLGDDWVPEYLQLHFPDFTPTAIPASEGGTKGARRIDFSLLRGFTSTGEVIDNPTSDHNALLEHLKETTVTTTPMTPAQWRTQLRKFDVPFREIPDWDNPQSGRDQETGLAFGPVYGGVMHHTGNDLSDAVNRKVILEGRSDLPGRLAHAGLADDGFIEMMTCWRANHAGGGDPDVLAAVKAESYGDYPPHTDKHQGEAGSVDGNDALYGLETYYLNNLTKAQYKSAVGFWAAVCDFHGWTAKSVIGHKEWSDWKVDPKLIDMKVFRRDIDARIAAVNAKQPAAEPVGPKAITPNITRAIAANIAYDKALSRIQLDAAEDERDAYRTQIKKQRRALRDLERK